MAHAAVQGGSDSQTVEWCWAEPARGTQADTAGDGTAQIEEFGRTLGLGSPSGY